MKRFLRDIYTFFISQRYEDPALLENYIRSQYGPFLLQNPYHKSESFYQAILAEAIPYLHADSAACDVGCGVGRLSFELARIARHTTGIDSSKKFIAFCKSIQQYTFIRYESSPTNQPHFICADVCTYPFEAESFDFISCINVIDRVIHPQLLVEVLGKALAHSGTLILSDPYDWELSPAAQKEHVSNIKQLLEVSCGILKRKHGQTTPYPFQIQRIGPTDATRSLRRKSSRMQRKRPAYAGLLLNR